MPGRTSLLLFPDLCEKYGGGTTKREKLGQNLLRALPFKSVLSSTSIGLGDSAWWSMRAKVPGRHLLHLPLRGDLATLPPFSFTRLLDNLSVRDSGHTAVYMYVCIVTHIARVPINRVRLPIMLVVSWKGKINISLSAFAPENLVSRDGFGSPV